MPKIKRELKHLPIEEPSLLNQDLVEVAQKKHEKHELKPKKI